FATATNSAPTGNYRKNLIVISGGTLSIAFLNFLGRVSQRVRIDVNAHVTRRTNHRLARLQAADRLPEVASAIGALKPELMGIMSAHRIRGAHIWLRRAHQ